MRILYLDFLYPKGHIRQNQKYISLLSNIAKVYVVCERNRYTDLPSEVEVIENSNLRIRDGQLVTRIDSLRAMIVSAIKAVKVKPDFILIASYDTIMYSIGRLFFPYREKLFLLQHSNIDELSSKIKKVLFRSYVKSINLVVFEEFIRDYLIANFKMSSDKVFILPHQLNENNNNENKKKYHCVGLSYSNDENLISQIVQKEQKESLFKNAECRVILKSKNLEFDNGYLKVIKGYLANDLYNDYIESCSCIYMPFPSSFKYRMSGTLADALSNNKLLLGSNIPVIEYYSSKYSSVCKIINSVDDFFRQVLSIEMKLNEEQIKDFEYFRCNHSDTAIEIAFKNMFQIS